MVDEVGDEGLIPAGERLPGRLAAVEKGWRIRRATVNRTWELAPPRAQPLVRVLSWGPYAFAAASVLAVVLRAHTGFWLLWVLGKGGLAKVSLVAAGGVALGRLSARLTAWYMRTIAGLQLTVGSLRGKQHGDLVRLRGTVRAEPSFPSAVSGEPTVLVHYEVRASERENSLLSYDEVRGIDFVVDVEGSEPVLVSAADAFITAGTPCKITSPADPTLIIDLATGGTRCREIRIAPCDRVEVIGIVSRELDPEA